MNGAAAWHQRERFSFGQQDGHACQPDRRQRERRVSMTNARCGRDAGMSDYVSGRSLQGLARRCTDGRGDDHLAPSHARNGQEPR